MKNLFSAILGAGVMWLVLSFITKDFEMISLPTLIIGIVLGFGIGKKEKETSD